MKRPMPTIILLVFSNLFMTVAWYWHLKGGPAAAEARPLGLVIAVSWSLALVEYCLPVPANRMASVVTVFSAVADRAVTAVATQADQLLRSAKSPAVP